MRRLLYFLLIVHYVAASNAVGQERTGVLVSELHHSSRDSGFLLDTQCSHLDGSLPNYRHAKPKPLCAAAIGQHQPARFLPHVSEREFHLQINPLKSLCRIECILSRAPPSQS